MITNGGVDGIYSISSSAVKDVLRERKVMATCISELALEEEQVIRIN